MIITNVFDRTVALLASQFQELLPNGNLTNFQKLIYCFCQEMQQIQNVLQQLLTQRSLGTAVGAQLDGLGQILGLDRIPGQPDDTTSTQIGYRESLQFQVFYNASNATPEEIIYIAGFITSSSKVIYNEYYPAAYQVIVNGQLTNGFFGAYEAITTPILLKNAGPAGVAYPPITTTNGVALPFSWSSDVLFEPLYSTNTTELPAALGQMDVLYQSELEPFYIQRGEKNDPFAGGGFSEYYNDDLYNDTSGSGQICEVVQLNGNLPP